MICIQKNRDAHDETYYEVFNDSRRVGTFPTVYDTMLYLKGRIEAL
jgi:hypothetical protein